MVCDSDSGELDIQMRLPRDTAPVESRRNQASVWIDRALGGVEVMALKLQTHAFPPHTHDTLMIGLVRAGCKAFEREGKTYLAPRGSISIVNPHELHTGRKEDGPELRYLSLYVPIEFLSEMTIGESNSGPPFFKAGVIEDLELYGKLACACRSLCNAESQLTRESVLADAMRLLAERYSEARLERPTGRIREPRGVREARDLIAARYAEELTIEEIAATARLSRYYLMRAFRHSVGLPIHAYQLQLRVERAKEMLASGRPVVEVALEVGFADQAHFTKRFRSLVGLTPAVYQRGALN